MFEVVYSKEIETNFQTVVGSHGVFLAYHGSSLENFHSIVHNGLLNMLNKVRLIVSHVCAHMYSTFATHEQKHETTMYNILHHV